MTKTWVRDTAKTGETRRRGQAMVAKKRATQPGQQAGTARGTKPGRSPRKLVFIKLSFSPSSCCYDSASSVFVSRCRAGSEPDTPSRRLLPGVIKINPFKINALLLLALLLGNLEGKALNST